MKLLFFFLQILNVYSLLNETFQNEIHETRKLLHKCNFQYFIEERILEFEYDLNVSDIYIEHYNNNNISMYRHVEILNSLTHEKNERLQELDMERIEKCGIIENNLYELENNIIY